MNDNLKRDGIIVATGATILYFLFRNKNKSAVISEANNVADNELLDIPQFKPSDFSVSSPDVLNDYRNYFVGGNTYNTPVSRELADKYIPLFGFITVSKQNQLPPVTVLQTSLAVPMYAQQAAKTYSAHAPTPIPQPTVTPPTVVNNVMPYVAPKPVAPAPLPNIVSRPVIVSQVVDYVSNASKYSNNPQPVNPKGNVGVQYGTKSDSFLTGKTKIFNKYSDGTFKLA